MNTEKQLENELLFELGKQAIVIKQTADTLQDEQKKYEVLKNQLVMLQTLSKRGLEIHEAAPVEKAEVEKKVVKKAEPDNASSEEVTK